MPYFDFHMHPTLKTLFSDPENKTSPFDKLDTRRIPGLLRWCTDLDFVLSSQANLDQLFRNRVDIMGFPLFIPDRALLDNKLVREDATKSNLKVYLNAEQLDQLIDGNPFENLLTHELPAITDTAQFGFPEKTVYILTNVEDYDGPQPDNLYVFFTLEGLHTLCNRPNDYDLDVIKTNLERITDDYPILSVNLCHMERSDVCNHAFGIQFINDHRFLPQGYGLNLAAYDMIAFLQERKILIDIKHMSLKSRLDLYKHYKLRGYDLPVICTHAGMTGISHRDINRYLSRRYRTNRRHKTVHLRLAKPMKYGNHPRPAFNASSINLYDEDVAFILQSGGLIGLSLDKRILGYVDWEHNSNSRQPVPNDTEYIAEREFPFFFDTSEGSIEIGEAIEHDQVLTWNDLHDGGLVNPALGRYHLRFFFQQIVHILAIAEQIDYSKEKALRQICLGSDFDGIINPIWCCESVDELDQFRELVRTQFVPFCEECGMRLPTGFDSDRFTENLFYENGKQFVLSYLPGPIL